MKQALSLIYYSIIIQLLDFYTTILFLKFGIKEANPIVNFLLDHYGHDHSVVGVFGAYKLVCLYVILFAVCIKKEYLVEFANYFFILAPIWNLYWIWKFVGSV